jgi:hypothetical protein
MRPIRYGARIGPRASRGGCEERNNRIAHLTFFAGIRLVAIAALGGLFAPLAPRRRLRLLLVVAGLGMLALAAVLFALQGPPMPSAARITFEAFPDGTPITEERILRGDEFLAAGIRLAGAPRSEYCPEGMATATAEPAATGRSHSAS